MIGNDTNIEYGMEVETDDSHQHCQIWITNSPIVMDNVFASLLIWYWPEGRFRVGLSNRFNGSPRLLSSK